MRARTVLFALITWASLVSGAFAGTDHAASTPAVQGYDLVSYHNSKRPIRGNGHFVSVHDGVTYLFANKENKNTFDRNPDRFLPAYGGYCAFGVSVDKKFVGDPEVWRVVDGRLYLNLDENIQDEWLKDVPGRIRTADENWKKIKNIPAQQL